MLKNKYVFWSGMGLWLVVLAGGGGWFWHHQQRATARQAVATEQAASEQTISPTTPPTSNQIISNTPASGSQSQTIIGSASGSAGATSSQGGTVAGDSTDVSKALDPKTFSQYDKYKTDQSAYYIDLQAGTGTALASGQQAAVYYRGWLTNGQLFDESKNGSDGKLQPFVFTDGQHQVISGWEQALTGMKVGGVRLLIVPPAVGYGAQAQNGIPANSVLVFQVQLAAVQ